MPGGIPFAELIASIKGDPAPLYRTLGQVRSALPGLLALGGVGGGVSIGLGFAAKTAIQFEASLAGLAKATDLGGDELAGMRDQIEALSVRLQTVPLEQLYEIATTGAKLGVATGDLLEYTEGIAKVSAAMDDVPAAQIADEIGKINIVFGLGVRGSQQLGSAIDKLADSGASSASGILNVTQRISGTATAAKLTAQETVSLAAALLDTGTEAEAASGSLVALLNALVNVEGQKGFAKVLGVSAKEFAARVRDKPIEAIQDFLGALSRLDAGAQQTALAEIGVEGDRAGGNLQKLALQAGNLSKYVGFANNEFLTLNQLTKSYQTQADLTQSSITRLWNQVQIAGRVVGDQLTPAIGAATATLGTIASKVPELVAAFTELAATDWGGQVAESFTANLPSAAGVMDTIIGGVRNFDLILQDTVLRVEEFALGVEAGFTEFTETITGPLDYGLQYIESWADQVFNVYARLVNRASDALSEFPTLQGVLGGALGGVPGAIAASGTKLEEVEVKVPELKEPTDFADRFKSLADARASVAEEIQSREDRRAAERLARDKAAAAESGAAARAQAGVGSLPTEGRKGAGETFSLQAFAERLQSGAFGKDDAAKKTADNTRESASLLRELVTTAKNPQKVTKAVAG